MEQDRIILWIYFHCQCRWLPHHSKEVTSQSYSSPHFSTLNLSVSRNDQFRFSCERVDIGNQQMFYICPLCMYTLGSWNQCENCTITDDYSEKCKLCNPCKLHRGYAVQIKRCNSCLEEICDSHSRGYLCSN